MSFRARGGRNEGQLRKVLQDEGRVPDAPPSAAGPWSWAAPPNWPQPPPGWLPSDGWRPEPGWGSPPSRWVFWWPATSPPSTVRAPRSVCADAPVETAHEARSDEVLLPTAGDREQSKQETRADAQRYFDLSWQEFMRVAETVTQKAAGQGEVAGYLRPLEVELGRVKRTMAELQRGSVPLGELMTQCEEIQAATKRLRADYFG